MALPSSNEADEYIILLINSIQIMKRINQLVQLLQRLSVKG